MLKKHIAPLDEETHRKATEFKIHCKAKDWNETINILLAMADDRKDITIKTIPHPISPLFSNDDNAKIEENNT